MTATVTELCPFCKREVEVPENEKSTCPECGVGILPCSSCSENCDWDPDRGCRRFPEPSGVLVHYTGICGLLEFPGVVLLDLQHGETPEQAVEHYFGDFFARGTVKDGAYYYSADMTEVVRVDGWRAVPPGDRAVLKKYL
jgi:hypothetical protein